MVIAILAVLGLIFGSFISALTWRLHEKPLLVKVKSEKPEGTSTLNTKDLSMWQGRSMCPNCHHKLGWLDLIPLFSWVFLRGRCRYCHKPISWQYPTLELVTAITFVGSYIFWPISLTGVVAVCLFVIWLVTLIPLLATAVYDARWKTIPNKFVVVLAVLAFISAILQVTKSNEILGGIIQLILAVLIGGGFFSLIFQVSKGKWIGGGDVKLGLALGLLATTAEKAVLLLFLASIIGTLYSLPLLVTRKLKRSSTIPFGPFLIFAIIVVVLFGNHIINWYFNLFTVG